MYREGNGEHNYKMKASDQLFRLGVSLWWQNIYDLRKYLILGVRENVS